MFVTARSEKQIVEQADALVIRIPAKRNLFMLAFLWLWLFGWAADRAPLS